MSIVTRSKGKCTNPHCSSHQFDLRWTPGKQFYRWIESVCTDCGWKGFVAQSMENIKAANKEQEIKETQLEFFDE